MYLPRMLPMALNALFRPLARAPMPAVAAKATRARIKRYSTKPWPASSLCRRAREFRTKVIIDVVSSEFFNRLAPNALGAAMGYAMPYLVARRWPKPEARFVGLIFSAFH